VQLLLAVCSSNKSHQVIGKLMDALILKDSTASARKTRYFGDSQLHRLKHRVMQSILVVEPLLDAVSVLVVTVSVVKLNFQSLQSTYLCTGICLNLPLPISVLQLASVLWTSHMTCLSTHAIVLHNVVDLTTQ
jgi:hypothetical protein